MSEKQSTALVPLDFSKEAVSKAVLRAAAENPLVTLPTAIGGAGLAASLLLGWPIWLAAPLLVGPALFIINYFGRRDVLAANFLQQLNAATRDQSKRMAGYLQGEFTELKFDRGTKQIEMLQKNLATIKTLRGEKFDKGDMSYESFLGPAEILVAQTLNVLKDAAAQLRANQTYDQTYDRKASKGKSGNGSVDRRRELYEEGTKHFDELIESAESAITGLAELAHDVAKIGSGGDHAEYIKRVKDVASRAGLYVDEKRI